MMRAFITTLLRKKYGPEESSIKSDITIQQVKIIPVMYGIRVLLLIGLLALITHILQLKIEVFSKNGKVVNTDVWLMQNIMH